MLRILLLSDLHGAVPPLPAYNRNNYDVVILAGDVTNGTKVESRIDAFLQKLSFLGEFYFFQGNSDYPALVEKIPSNPKAKVLHQKCIRVGDYEILGSGGATTGLINYSAFTEVQFEKNLREVYSSARVTPDYQILVTHDMLGLFEKFRPKFVRRYLEAADLIKLACGKYSDDVRKGGFPNMEESF